jgi:hypothetical protein
MKAAPSWRLVLLLFVLVLPSRPALAVLDQQFPWLGFGGPNGITVRHIGHNGNVPANEWAQTFTVGITGSLTQVRVSRRWQGS